MLIVNNLSKRFRMDNKAFKQKQKTPAHLQDKREDGHWFYALKNISFSCQPGEVLGLLGPNGAGKTTCLRMLSTALKATCGKISIDGVDVVANPQAMRQRIGFLSGTTSLYHRLTVRENLAYFGSLHGIASPQLKQRIEEVIKLLDMRTFADKKADKLSTGMKQRTHIARAIIHQPKLVVLDEPTTGLDVISAQAILQFIQSYKGGQVPVIFSTHHLHEVEKLCDKVVLIDKGETQFNGTLNEFKQASPEQNLYDSFMQIIVPAGEE